MQNYRNGIRVEHIEKVSIPFDAGKDLPVLVPQDKAKELFPQWSFFEQLNDSNLNKTDSVLPPNWFELFNKEIDALLRILSDCEVKQQLTLLRDVTSYGYYSLITDGLVLMNYDPDISDMFNLYFSFQTHEDAEKFLFELWKFTENL